MGLQSRLDGNGMNSDGDVVVPVPFSGRNARLYRHSAPQRRTPTPAATTPVAPTTPTSATPSVRQAQVVHLPLFQNPHVAGIAEKHGFSQSPAEVTMLDSIIRTFTRMGFQVVDPRFNAVIELKRTDDVSGQVVTVRIARDISRVDSLPKWKMHVLSSDGKHSLNSFSYPHEQFEEFVATYATRFQVNSVTPLDLSL